MCMKAMAQIYAREALANCDIVSQLVLRPFSSRSVAEQTLIVQEHRPMPNPQFKTNGRAFQLEWYKKKDWLCASEVLNGLFC